MSLLATLLASNSPAIHIYDGVKVARETTRVVDTLSQAGLFASYKAILEEASTKIHKRADAGTKTIGLLDALNNDLGTEYKLFEYAGHATPDVVLVVFGTVESSLALQVASSLQNDDVRVGVVCVRVYRPFVEEEFIKVLPSSVRKIGVLGQVQDKTQVKDEAVQSALYRDVLAAVAFSSDFAQPPEVVEIKYPRSQIWKPVDIAAALQLVLGRSLFNEAGAEKPHLELLDSDSMQQYTFWNLDESETNLSSVLGKLLSSESSHNVTVSTRYDNLTQGGVHRTDIRNAKRIVDAPYSVEKADTAYVGDERLLKAVDVCQSVKAGGNLIIRLPGVKDDADLEKRISANVAKAIKDREIQLHVFDPQKVDDLSDDVEPFALQQVFLRVALPKLGDIAIPRLASMNGNMEIFQTLSSKIDDALRQVEIPDAWLEKDSEPSKLPTDLRPTSFVPFPTESPEPPTLLKNSESVAKSIVFKEAYGSHSALRPEMGHPTWTVTLREHRRLTPETYDRNIMHLDFDLGDSGLQYNIGDSLGIHPRNDHDEVMGFITRTKLDPEAVVELSSRDDAGVLRALTVYQALVEYVDIFGKPGRQFYEALGEFATDVEQAKALKSLGGPEGAVEFKRRSEVDTVTFADILEEFPSAQPSFHELVRLVPPLKRREYSIASCQKVQPTTVSLMIVTVDWVDPRGRDRFGLATRYLDQLAPGDRVTVSLKPSVMKLPPRPTDPIIMAGLGTGLAPFRAFVQHRAWERAQGTAIGPVLLYMGSRHKREEYCYGEEWEAYRDAGVVTLLSCAFSRDQPQKIYIQDRMRETGQDLQEAYLEQPGAFYLCGPTWPVPDVTKVLEERIARFAEKNGKRVKTRSEIEKLKDEGRYVLEVY
jgi:sulfite reductase (NADPH) flavoprotein alpha-component